MGFGDADEGGGWVDGCYVLCCWEAGCGGRENAAAAADVQVGLFVGGGWGGGRRGETGFDEVVPERVHEVEES